MKVEECTVGAGSPAGRNRLSPQFPAAAVAGSGTEFPGARPDSSELGILFDSSPLPMWVYCTESLRFLAVNKALVDHYGYSREEFLGMTVLDIRPDEDRAALLAVIQKGNGEHRRSERLWRHLTRDGRMLYVEIDAQRLPQIGPTARLVVVHDVTARQEAAQRLDHMFSSMRCLLWEAEVRRTAEGFDWIVRFPDEAAALRFLPIQIDPGQPFADAWHLSKHEEDRLLMDANAMGSLLVGKAGYSQEFRCRCADGAIRWLHEDVRVHPSGAGRWRLVGVATDITELKRGQEDLQRSHAALVQAYDTTIEGWSRALDLRDRETEGHTERVTEMTVELARAVGIPEEQIVQIRRGALLHDIGKMGIPDEILLKPGKLTDEEWVIMKKHPLYAYDLLFPVEFLRPALEIPLCHHEKWDGTGYPHELKGEQIPLSARLFAVVDVWDALSSDRPYRAAWPREKVLAHIRQGSGSHFDPAAVEAFMQMVHRSGGCGERPQAA